MSRHLSAIIFEVPHITLNREINSDHDLKKYFFQAVSIRIEQTMDSLWPVLWN